MASVSKDLGMFAFFCELNTDGILVFDESREVVK